VQYNKSITSKINVPVLMLWGTEDNYLTMGSAKGSRRYVADFTERYFTGVSHWVMAEVPDAFNEAVEEYLDKRKIR
jgi:pimeloyl-ACP methyl ester carboxylesterase